MISLNEQIREARNYAEAIVTTIREPLLVLDMNLRVKSANKAFYKTFQVAEQETEGVFIYDLGNRQWNIPDLRLLLEKILPEKGTFAEVEVRHSFPNKGERIMRLNASEMLRENGAERLILLAIADITEQTTAQKKIEESEEHFRTMADLMPAKISNANPDGGVTYFNKQWLEFSGYGFEELKDFGYHKMIHPDEIEEFRQRLQKAATIGTGLEMEMRFLNKKGDYIWHLNLAAPVRDEEGKIKMWVGVTTEIQTQKEQEQELEKAVRERTAELHEASEALQQKNEQLIKTNVELESFTYVSSHDLQEPLRKIQTFASRILEKEYAVLSDTGKEYFQRMSSSAARMQTLIEDLLAYSHTTLTERKFEKTDLNKIVQEVRAELAEIIQEKGATIEVGVLGEAAINSLQFRQVTENLITNSLKFSKPGIPSHIIINSEIEIGSEIQQQKLAPERLYRHIRFSDNGIGFNPQYEDKIFEVFQRLHGKEEYAGTGIGLAIVKKIIENHNGIVTASSELGQGTTFDIYIPE